MKITQVVCQILRIPNIQAKTASSQDSVLVRVRTDDGLEGVGEADSSPEVVKAIIDAPFSHNIACGLRQLLVGENPLEHERLWQKMYRRTMYFGRKAVGITAMAAVDMALWDLKGKAFGQPIHRLLGGKQHDRIRGYASILFGRDGKETADIARRWVERRLHRGQVRLGADGHVRSGRHRPRARRARRARRRPRCSSTPAASAMPARPCGGRTRSRSTRPSGSRSRCARTTSTATSGCATARRSRSRPAKGSAAASRSARSSTAGRSTSTRSTSRGAASPTPRTSAPASRRSAPGSATTATPARSPWPRASTGSAPAATRSCSRTASRTRRCGTN